MTRPPDKALNPLAAPSPACLSTRPATGAEPRRIIHLDMDCFYAAIEIRDRPELRGRPVAVGGSPSQRGVLTTCNYEARAFGCRSAMPTFQALRLCPKLLVLPPRFELYHAESRRIREIFARFTSLVEPLSLDEAYLDISHWRSSGSSVAWEIRGQIRESTGLTASAGIAPNKLLAKIASDWKKPDGQFEIRPGEVAGFVRQLPVRRLWGVGGRTAEKFATLGIHTCADLQRLPLSDLTRLFGRFGFELFQQCRGIDERPVEPARERKSLSSERTYPHDLLDADSCLRGFGDLYREVLQDAAAQHSGRRIRSLFVKMRFSDFRRTTAERSSAHPSHELLQTLAREAWNRARGRGVRLLGVGLRFQPEEVTRAERQLEMFP
ncbi:MAG TPA: DNA polymerase IV [Verrucomicrobiales bacterium]|nr:DNA polymerase IV [Verrucomicrobiales bacterium]